MPESSRPLIIQSDRSLLLEVNHPAFEAARDALLRFAELEKSPEYIHTYRITPLSLWNAASAGMTAKEVLEALETFSRYDLPPNVRHEVREYMGRYGRLRLIRTELGLILESDDEILMTEVWRNRKLAPYFLSQLGDGKSILVAEFARGHLKQGLIRGGYPVEDLAGYIEGKHLDLSLRDTTLLSLPFALRPYQDGATSAFYAGGGPGGGSGVIVLPCGAGKTVVGMAVMSELKTETLILCTNITAVKQWRDELLDKTTLTPEQIGEYTGEHKDIKPVTIATYQILTYRKTRDSEFIHFGIFNAADWGLIIYDEVHLLPAPIFRISAEIQARRRLGLTATLVREDGLETDVFSLIGPKKYDVPWKELETKGYIAQALCTEIRVNMPRDLRITYATADVRARYRLAMENPAKLPLVQRLVERHKGDRVLVIGQYLNQLHSIASMLHAPIITGSTPERDREKIYGQFRRGDITLLVVSKVANFAVDLPDANVAVQVSGTFGSRQEEAQRLGRVLRPKPGDNRAYFYSLVTRDSSEQEFAINRQLFLTEEGYTYQILDEEAIE